MGIRLQLSYYRAVGLHEVKHGMDDMGDVHTSNIVSGLKNPSHRVGMHQDTVHGTLTSEKVD